MGWKLILINIKMPDVISKLKTEIFVFYPFSKSTGPQGKINWIANIWRMTFVYLFNQWRALNQPCTHHKSHRAQSSVKETFGKIFFKDEGMQSSNIKTYDKFTKHNNTNHMPFSSI